MPRPGPRSTIRQLRAYGPEDICIEGLTKGPRAGWSWDGEILSHRIGIRMRMSPAAAERITAAVAACRPGHHESLSGVEMAELSEAERSEFELTKDGWGEDEHDNEHVWRWVRSTNPVAGECEFDTTEVLEITRGR